MTQAKPTPPRGATSRADLLRALAVAPREHLALDIDAHAWFGYVRKAETPQPMRPIDSVVPRVTENISEYRRKLPLQMPHAHVIVERQPRQPPDQDTQTAVFEAAEPITEDDPDAKAPSDQRLIAYEDLVPPARLLPALRRLLGSTRAGPLDLDRLIQCLASSQLPRHLPRRRLQRWHPECVVLLDFCPRLWPYREDMHRLAERLLRQCGRSGVSLRIVNHGPLGPWSDWLAHQNVQARAEPAERPWTMPTAGTPVLIVSDLGLLLGAGTPTNQAWQSFITRLNQAQLRPVALVPLGASQLDGSLAQLLPILRWSPDARAHPERAHGTGQPQPDGLDDLLAMAAATRRVDPPLLRAMRRLNPIAPLDAGLEGALWCHAEVAAGSAASVRIAAQEKHLRRFAGLLPHLQLELEQLRHNHHAHLRAVLNHEETWLWRSHAAVDNADLPDATRQRLVKADAFMAKLVATLRQSDSLQKGGIWWSVARDIVQRADADMGEQYARLLTPLAAALARVPGAMANLPDWVDPAALASLLDDGRGPLRCWLVRDAAQGSLLLQAQAADVGQSPLGEALSLDVGGARLHVGADTHGRWVSVGDLPVMLASLGEATTVHLETSAESITVAAVSRPRGALEWGCDGGGIKVRTAPLGGFYVQWGSAELRGVQNRRQWMLEAAAKSPPFTNTLLQFGMDEFGLWAEFNLATAQGSATQRLRWIEPGSFLMGSPEEEPMRESDEGPRHAVTLTQGFWLADSACTQALWLAVMGANPSYFKDNPENPVEQVSWNDVQTFLRKLEERLPGCKAALPTEAEWEYACRAGTGKPFSFGAQITPEQVNYDGNYPYAGGEKGQYREKTVPVKSLPPNAWGLYEMHGNVWEWCADGQRKYDGQPQIDPTGPVPEQGQDTPPALRGGSWISSARWARSAYRSASPPGIALRSWGFRLCLRSIEPSPATGQPGGRGGSPTPTRDEEGAASAKRPFLPEWLNFKRKKKQ